MEDVGLMQGGGRTAPAMLACPVCGSGRLRDTVIRDLLPTMQNRVYRGREQARAARKAGLRLAICEACDYAWNRLFDPTLLEYDSDYDNAVPSAVMGEYYRDIARYLGDKYRLTEGLVVDVGCGTGTFLKTLIDMWPGCRGLGVDPALEADGVSHGGRIQLVKGLFSTALLRERPALIVCRHVLEHIPSPVSFVTEMCRADASFADVPLFVEVPDLSWILEHRSFWDFCYEHCNYFTADGLAATLTRGGFTPTATQVSFGDQYRWMEARAASVSPGASTPGADGTVGALVRYADGEASEMDAMRRRLAALKSGGANLAVWGMATKGVIFSLLLDPESSLIDYCVDVNANKQGCFVPLTGHRIDAPSVLQTAAGRSLNVVVMNTNYAGEIKGTCDSLGLAASFIDANGIDV